MSFLMSEATKVNLLDAVNAQTGGIEYRGYIISYDPPPIPIRSMDWHFVHTNYDGAPDGHDYRCGDAGSLGECMADIDEQIEEGL